MTLGTRRRLTLWATLLAAVLLASTPAQGLEQVSGGVSLGAFQAGTIPRLAVSPHAGISWRTGRDFVVTIHDLCNLLPPMSGAEIGVFNEASIAVGYTSEKSVFSAGPSFSIYYLPACGLTLCGRVVGIAPGVHAQTEIYNLAGPLGVSVSANVDWVGGRSLVLPGGAAITVVAGPVLRWRAN